MRRILPPIVSAFVLVACSGASAAPPPLNWERGSLSVETASGVHTFSVEIADEPDERERGLMYRTEMAADAGMIFAYDSPQIITIWMKNTVLPLDIIYVNEQGRVMTIAPDAEPYSLKLISSQKPVVAAIEFNAGTAARIGLKPGDTVRSPFFHNVKP
jgi:uncharacterized membrane protein (UPF0127 family)